MIEQNLKNIEKELELIRKHLKIEIQADYIGADTFLISWIPREGKGDIRYGINNFEHSYKNYVSEIDLLRGSVEIEVGQKGNWQFKLIGDVDSAPVESSNVDTDETAEKRFINMGMWYSSDFGNVRRVWISEIPDSGNFIPRIGGFEADESESKWRQRLNRGGALKDIDPSRVPYVILRDEPFAKGFTTSQLERLIEIAKEEIGDFHFTYTFTRSAIEKGEQLPKNTGVIGINFYPFYLESCDWCEQIWTEQEFYDFFDEIMQKARQQSAPGARFSITGQGFYDKPDGRERWRKPPIEAPIWYMNFINRNADIETLLWFFEKSNDDWIGIDQMPGFRGNLERALEGVRGL